MAPAAVLMTLFSQNISFSVAEWFKKSPHGYWKRNIKAIVWKQGICIDISGNVIIYTMIYETLSIPIILAFQMDALSVSCFNIGNYHVKWTNVPQHSTSGKSYLAGHP